jgi:transcriptional regulator of acetoin/glycerol metabolism
VSWEDVTSIIRELVPDQAAAIEAQITAALGGLRVSIPRRPAVTVADAHEAVRLQRGNVERAARKLGVSRASIYRRIRQPTRDAGPGPRLPGTGRVVR